MPSITSTPVLLHNHKFRVLIIEDNNIKLLLITTILNRIAQQASVKVVKNGQEAFESYSSFIA